MKRGEKRVPGEGRWDWFKVRLGMLVAVLTARRVVVIMVVGAGDTAKADYCFEGGNDDLCDAIDSVGEDLRAALKAKAAARELIGGTHGD